MIGAVFETNDQIQAQEDAEIALEMEARERQNQPVITSLAAHVRSCWQAAKDAKRDIEDVMIESLRRKKGEYSPSKLREIREQGGSEIFMALTDEKCAAVSSWLMDTLFPSDGDKPWGVEPTPVPELSPEQMQGVQQRVQGEMMADLKDMVIMEIEQGAIQSEQQAFQRLQQLGQKRAESLAAQLQEQMQQAAKDARDKIERKLDDVIAESSWDDALSEVVEDIATFPCGILKGPVLRRKKKLTWTAQQQQMIPQKPSQPMPQPGVGVGQQMAGAPGAPMPVQGQQTQGYPINTPPPVQVLDNVELEFSRVSPLDIYPMPNARTPEDGIFERHSMSGKEFSSLVGVDGFDDEAVRLVLKEYGRYGKLNWLNADNDTDRRDLEDRPHEDKSPVGRIEILQYWDNIQGLMLLEHGMDASQVPDPLDYYSAEVWLVDNIVIKAELNGDPLGRVPYHKASFRERNGSFWGSGPPQIIKDSQEACNAAARNIINNMSISSGPQVVYDISQLPPGMDLEAMRPWKIWQINGTQSIGGATGRSPVSFAMPPSVTGELMAVYEFFSNEADTKLGVPKYTYGGDAKGGALETASGLSIMMGNATRGIKNVVRSMDRDLVKPTIERLHEWLLMYSGDPEYYEGDIKLFARGTTAMIIKEQVAVRRNELLQTVVSSPPILGIIGERGLAAMLRDIFGGVDFTADDIVPSEEDIAKKMMQQQVAQQRQAQAQMQMAQQKALGTDKAGAVQGGRDARVV